jgi:hypothetical protein
MHKIHRIETDKSTREGNTFEDRRILLIGYKLIGFLCSLSARHLSAVKSPCVERDVMFLYKLCNKQHTHFMQTT